MGGIAGSGWWSKADLKRRSNSQSRFQLFHILSKFSGVYLSREWVKGM